MTAIATEVPVGSTTARLNAARRMRRASIVIRRIPDEEGKLVTYLPATAAAETVQLSPSTIRRWIRQGIVRYTDRLVGQRNVAVVDLARIKKMTPKESLALGIRRIPPNEILQQTGWYYREQAETFKTASRRREVYTQQQDDYIIAAVEEGLSLEAMAKELNRTYSGVSGRIDRLRRSGDLPPMPNDGLDWLDRATRLLTDEERATLQV